MIRVNGAADAMRPSHPLTTTGIAESSSGVSTAALNSTEPPACLGHLQQRREKSGAGKRRVWRIWVPETYGWGMERRTGWKSLGKVDWNALGEMIHLGASGWV